MSSDFLNYCRNFNPNSLADVERLKLAIIPVLENQIACYENAAKDMALHGHANTAEMCRERANEIKYAIRMAKWRIENGK